MLYSFREISIIHYFLRNNLNFTLSKSFPLKIINDNYSGLGKTKVWDNAELDNYLGYGNNIFQKKTISYFIIFFKFDNELDKNTFILTLLGSDLQNYCFVQNDRK